MTYNLRPKPPRNLHGWPLLSWIYQKGNLKVSKTFLIGDLPRHSSTTGSHGLVEVMKENGILLSGVNLIDPTKFVIFPATSHMNFGFAKYPVTEILNFQFDALLSLIFKERYDIYSLKMKIQFLLLGF